MMKALSLVLLLCLLLVCSFVHGANIRFQNSYGSNMVLQRNKITRIIGFTSVGDKVDVSIFGKSFVATVSASGEWFVDVQVPAEGGPFTITATGTTSGSATLQNVLVGDVYVCGGQSNMQFTVHSAYNATEEIALAAKYPQIRVMTVGQGNISFTPLQELASIEQQWSVASPAAIGANDWGYFSAVCWFYGRYLADAHPGVAVGLISNNWGGTIVQAWSSPDALAKCKTETPVDDDSITAPNPNQNSVLWNAMIVPFLNQTIAGALWYQGESNSGDAKGYACMFPAMIADWRVKWRESGAFPFFFVQLAPWTAGAGTAVADTRQAQLAALELPGVGFATAVDLGDATSPQGNIHPRDKETVGKRLLLAARAIAYKESNVVYRGPEMSSIQYSTTAGSSTYKAIVSFAQTASGLELRPASCPAGVAPVNCENWSFLLSDGKWYPTSAATIDSSDRVVVTLSSGAPASLTPVGLRYAYSSWPQCTVFSKDNLPAIPFEHTKQ